MIGVDLIAKSRHPVLAEEHWALDLVLLRLPLLNRESKCSPSAKARVFGESVRIFDVRERWFWYAARPSKQIPAAKIVSPMSSGGGLR
jgi:hypothetical protein